MKVKELFENDDKEMKLQQFRDKLKKEQSKKIICNSCGEEATGKLDKKLGLVRCSKCGSLDTEPV